MVQSDPDFADAHNNIGIVHLDLGQLENAAKSYKSALESASPMGRLGTVEDIASAILYLASDEAKFTTGSEIVVDGGLTAT